MAASLGIAPERFIYLGDTNTDMKTAVAAGMYPVGALWGFRTAEELTASGARLLIRRPMDALKAL
jgi:phosphoglycolate phosphatase